MNLNNAANVAVIVAATAVIGLAVKDRIAAAPKKQQTVAQRFMGKQLPLPDRSALGIAATAVLFTSKSCHFCEESMPFYQQLSAARWSRRLSIIVAVPEGRETREDGIALFADHRVAVDGIFPVRFGDVGVSGTPTVVLLDAAGSVKGVWNGRLSSEKETEVLSQINALISAHRAE